MIKAFINSVLSVIVFCLSFAIHRIFMKLNYIPASELWFWGSLVGFFFIVTFISHLIFTRKEI